MPKARLELYERSAAQDAGNDAGTFLDEIGITDLAQLSEGQWSEFIRRVIVGFEKNLRTRLLSGEEPF